MENQYNLTLVYRCGHKKCNTIQVRKMSVKQLQKRNPISEEFKRQIVDLYQAGGSINYLSLEYGVANATIYKGIRGFSSVQVSDTKGLSLKEYKKTHYRTRNGK